MRNLLLISLGLSVLLRTTLGYPSSSLSPNLTVFKDPDTGLKYFWHPTEEGEMVKAFLEGGPPATVEGIEDDVHFFFYSKTNPSPIEFRLDCVDCVNNSPFTRNAPVKFVSHGFMSSYQSDINLVIRTGYFSSSQFVNIIHVNWERLAAAPHYDTAAANTKPVGEFVARFIDWMVANGFTTYDKVHFVGHSLGSHVGGYAGTNTDQKIARISALDPALPLFGEKPNSDRIDPSDANFVDVIHTAGGDLAFFEPRGHVDFYPNGGKAYQPGCGIDLISTCSHSRAYEFFGESIWHTNGFPAYKCNNWEEYNSGSCSMTERAYLGEPTSTAARGSFYLRTNQNPPFGQE